jgi:hypothetical protein
MKSRQFLPEVVHQMWFTAPLAFTSAKVNTSPAFSTTYGLIFQPRPKSRAQPLAGPSSDMPPLPFSPVKFSAEIERVFAFVSLYRLPKLLFNPLNIFFESSLFM